MKTSTLTGMANSLLLLAITLPITALADTEKVSTKATNKKATEQDVEVIEVVSRRNQANSEMTEQTEQLMSVAGIGNDP